METKTTINLRLDA